MEPIQFESLAQSLAPTLQNLELKRKELKAAGSKVGLYAGLICLALGAVASFFLEAIAIGMGISVVVAVIAWFCTVNTYSGTLSEYYKKEVIAQVLQSICPNATFTPQQGISESTFRSCGLFNSPDRYHTEDLIQGRVDKTEFRCAEVHAEEEHVTTDSKGRTRRYWVDIFKGFLFIADFQKDFRGHTTVRRDSLIKFNFDGSRVKLENPLFEKKFDVHSTDQVEARYLLTPAMMERLLALEADFKGGITVSFRNSNILIAIPNSRNHFEASIWKPVTDPKLLQNDFGAIHSLISIVEDLNLNTRIWTKE